MSKKKNINQTFGYDPDYAVAPGDTLREVLDGLSMTQKELATRTGLTEQTIVRIIKGLQPITFETAIKLEMVTSVPARMWNNLEMQYREQLSKIEQSRELEQSKEWVKSIPILELKARGVLPDVSDTASIAREALRFYGVSNVDAWHDVWTHPEVAARRSDSFETDIGAASAWLRLGEIEAREIVCEPFNKDLFKQVLHEIRRMTVLAPEQFLDQLRDVCARAGVALSLVREFKKVPWNGASKWLSQDKVMIMLNLRGKGEDIFWFSFYHEAYHVLYGEKKRLYIAGMNSKDSEEQKADRFAANTLIPKKYNTVIANITTRQEIINLAHELAVSPGIVAGRYRHLTGNWSYFKDLTRTFTWE